MSIKYIQLFSVFFVENIVITKYIYISLNRDIFSNLGVYTIIMNIAHMGQYKT